jgi:hypothetical protein
MQITLNFDDAALAKVFADACKDYGYVSKDILNDKFKQYFEADVLRYMEGQLHEFFINGMNSDLYDEFYVEDELNNLGDLWNETYDDDVPF